jgi:A/G-specific adenine glycosylase
MPWRGIADPYRVWISEIMLQQTTVAAVVPYFERFLARFPDLASLAAAEQQEVLALWEGLGYYSRGRNLHRAAGIVVAEHGGRFPEGVEQLRSLPGIGRYTAGAIASFAFDRRTPILEANTQRVYARLTGYAGDPRTSSGQAALWQFAETILPAKNVGAFNQALIDLGALVCLPVAPRCMECPAMTLCRAYQTGRQDEIPPPKLRPVVTEVHEVAVAVRNDKRWLVRQRQPDERWSGMWDFPRLSLDGPGSQSALEQTKLLRRLCSTTGLEAAFVTSLPSFSHSVTRYRIRLNRIVAGQTGGTWNQSAPVQWLTLKELAGLPMPMAARRFVSDLVRPGWDPET